MTGGPIRILCLGNELVSDDGVGIRVGRVLAQLPLPAGVTVEFQLGIGLELMDSLRPAEELIIVDAAQTGAPPGTCHITELDVEAMAGEPFCHHGVTIIEVLALVSCLMPEKTPARVRLVAIEGAVMDRFDPRLSPTLKQVLPRAVEIVLQAMGAPQALLDAGARKARAMMDWTPSPADLPDA